MKKTKPLAPFLKYCGGKTWLAPKLAEMYEPFRNTHTWVEPFCGALGATLGVMPERAILSDANPHLINLYSCIDNGLENTVGTSIYWQNSQNCFDLIKRDFNRSIRSKQFLDSGFTMSNEWMSKSFYYLNRTCFNGLCRFNRKGEFNVGYGKYKKPKLDHDFSLYQEAFKNWGFLNIPYPEAFANIQYFDRKNYFIYADPPYDGGFTGYSGSFTWDNQVSLASSLVTLNCPVVASNKATDRVIDLYQGLGFDVELVDVRRRIACNGDRTDTKEILATRNL